MEYLETYFNEQYVDSYLIEHWGALLNFVSTLEGFFIWIAVTILLPVAIVVYFQKNYLLYLLMVIVVFSAFIAERALRLPGDEILNRILENEQPPKEEIPTVNTQESSQVKVKENTINLNCTALENGEYQCKKQK